MSRLTEILDSMTLILHSLKEVIDAEQLQLSTGSLHSSALHRLTEEKSSLLTTLDYLDQQRRRELECQYEANEEILQRWANITELIRQLRNSNQHNGWLLDGQLERNKQALQLLKPHQDPGLYGKNGQTASTLRGGKKFSV